MKKIEVFVVIFALKIVHISGAVSCSCVSNYGLNEHCISSRFVNYEAHTDLALQCLRKIGNFDEAHFHIWDHGISMLDMKENVTRTCDHAEHFLKLANATPIDQQTLKYLQNSLLYKQKQFGMHVWKIGVEPLDPDLCPSNARALDLFLNKRFLKKSSFEELSKHLSIDIVLELASRHTDDPEWNSCAVENDTDYHESMFDPFLTIVFHFNGSVNFRSATLWSSKIDSFSSWPSTVIGVGNGGHISADGRLASIFVADSFNLAFAFRAVALAFSKTGFFIKFLQEHRYPMSLKFPISKHAAIPSAPENFRVVSQKVFQGSSIEFIVDWTCPKVWNGVPASYELVCLVVDTLLQLSDCKDCSKRLFTMENCIKCWEMISKEQSVILRTTVPWTMYKHKFFLQTNLPNLKIHDNLIRFVKSFGKAPTSYLFHFDWHKSHAKSEFAFDKSEANYWKQLMQMSLMLPGSSDYPTPLTHGEILNLRPVCRVRGILRDGDTPGTWSKPVVVNFTSENSNSMLIAALLANNSIDTYMLIDAESRIALSFNDIIPGYDKSTWNRPGVRPLADMSQNGPVIIREVNYNTSEPKPSTMEPRIGCYHWLLSMWFAFLKLDDGSYILAKYDGDTGQLAWDELTWTQFTRVTIYGKPYQMRCAALHPLVLWSEISKDGEISINGAELNPICGNYESKINLRRSDYCSCSETPISSPSFDILYCKDCPDLELFLFTVCGNNVCRKPLMGASYHSIQHQSLSFSTGNHSGIIGIAVDYEKVFYLTAASRWLTMVQTGDIQKVKDIDQILIASQKPDFMVLSTTPGVKSHMVTKIPLNTSSGYKLLDLKVARDASSLPQPPASCIFPKVIIDGKADMVTNRSVRVKIKSEWESGSLCDGLAKPKVVYYVDYAIIPKAILDELDDISCCQSDKLTFLSEKTEQTRSTEHTFEFSGLKTTATYCFKLSIEPVLNETVRYLWYAGIKNDFKCDKEKIFYKPDLPATFAVILAAVCSAVVVFILVSALFAFLAWRYNRKYYMYRYLQRLSSDQIRCEELLGRGHFGEVWKATLHGHGNSMFRKTSTKKQTVAIKILKESASDHDEKEFREEALLLSKLENVNVVKFIGICMQSRPMMIALEYMNGGSLDMFLRLHQTRDCLGTAELLNMALDAINGCIYLEQEGFIHCDLSARNCLVQTQHDSDMPQQVKLSDFGLAKDTGSGGLYQSMKKDKQVPFAWTAPEAFAGKFSSKSDIWAYGVLLWEIFTWASRPFQHCSKAEQDHECPLSELNRDEVEYTVCVSKKTLLNFQHPCNNMFSDALIDIMKICWLYDADQRPDFKQLRNFLQGARRDICAVPSSGAEEWVNLNFQSSGHDDTRASGGGAIGPDNTYEIHSGSSPLVLRAQSEYKDLRMSTKSDEYLPLVERVVSVDW